MFSFSSLTTASDENEPLVGFSYTLVSATAVVRIKKAFSGHLIGEEFCTGSALFFGFARPLVLGTHRPFHVPSLLEVSTNSLKPSCAYTVPDLPFCQLRR